MSVADLLDRATAAGVTLEPRGGRLKLHAPVKPPEDLIEDLRTHKVDLLEYLAPASPGRSSSPPRLVWRDLRYPLPYVLEQLPTLSQECRDHYEETLEIGTEPGWWDEETRQRYAFGRMVDEMLTPRGRDA